MDLAKERTPKDPVGLVAFSGLVVALDEVGSGRPVLEAVRSLARRSGAPVELVTVISPGLPEMADRDELESLAALVDVSAMATVLHGNDVAATLVAYLQKRPSPLLCLASSGRGPLGALLFGSVSEQLIRSTPYPVMMIGPSARAITSLSTTLLVCLDGSEESEQILPIARAWVASFGGDVRVVRHLDEHDTIPDSIRAARLQLAQAVEWFGQRSVAANSEILEGRSAGESVGEAARHVGVAAIAMTTRARSPLRRLEFGSVALQVARDASRAVLLLNPQPSA